MVVDKEKQSDAMDYEDKMASAIGHFRRWQIMIYAAVIIPTKMSAAFTLLNIVFLAPKTTYRCIQLLNSTEEIQNNTCYDNCIKYTYFTDYENTIISQFDLICERTWLVSFSQTVCMTGALIGSMVFGFIADRYGRRVALLIAAMLHVSASFVIPFSPNYWTFTSMRFLLGASAANIMVISFVILMEIVGPKKRELVNTLYSLPMAVGHAVMPLFSYYLRSWEKFSFGIAIPTLIFLMYIYIVPESPKWLISMQRLEEASVVMTRAAKNNKLPSDNMLKIAESIAEEKKPTSQKQSKASYWDLVTVPSLRINNLVSCISWFNIGFCFYGGNQYIGRTSSNVLFTVALAGGLQIPGMLACGYFLKRFGRRNTIIACYFIMAICNGLLMLPDDWFYVKMVAGALGVGVAGTGFAGMYIYTSELFPTVARNMAMGASSTASRLGSMLAPFVASLTTSAYWVSPLIFAIVPMAAAFACFYLPETKGKKMEDHI